VSLNADICHSRVIEILLSVQFHADPFHYSDRSYVSCCCKRHDLPHSQRLECHLENGHTCFRYETSSPKAAKKPPQYFYAWSEGGVEGRHRKSDDSGELFVALQSGESHH
jgi:hypothetical protein